MRRGTVIAFSTCQRKGHNPRYILVKILPSGDQNALKLLSLHIKKNTVVECTVPILYTSYFLLGAVRLVFIFRNP